MKTKNIKIISVDAANKSLAVACLEYHNNIAEFTTILSELKTGTVGVQITNAFASTSTHILAQLDRLIQLLDNISIRSLTVVDLIPGKKIADTNLTERTCALQIFLANLTKDLIKDKWFDHKSMSSCGGSNVHLIIEYQMGPNRKSGDVQSQIIYHFLQYLPENNIHIVGPSLKNKLRWHKDPLSYHNHYVSKYQTLYAANKAHTKYLFLVWLRNNNQLDKLNKIKKKNYSDIADAFCQAVGYANGAFC